MKQSERTHRPVSGQDPPPPERKIERQYVGPHWVRVSAVLPVMMDAIARISLRRAS